MKRREFISCLATAPLALGSAWAAPSMPEALAFGLSPKRRIALGLESAERELLALLGRHTEACHLHGAPVMARLCGASPAWFNVLGTFGDFTSLKRELFAAGVTPISTPDLPSSMIKFRFGERIFNLVNAGVESFCQSTYFAARERKLAFSHSFIVWNPATGELHDPLDAVPASGKPRPFQFVGRPGSLADGFDWVLAGRFEAHHLGMPLSDEFMGFEERTLAGEAPPALGRFIAERVVNYFPEVVDLLGMDVAGRFANSPLVGAAVRDGLGIDFARVFADFCQIRGPKPRFKGSGVEFMGALHQAPGLADEFTILQGDICRFMIRNRFTFRRPEWLIPPTAVPNLETLAPALA